MPRPAPSRLVWILAFLVLTVAVATTGLISLYLEYRKQLERELGFRLVAVASASAAALDGPVWAGILRGDPEVLAEVRRDLESVRATNGVSDIFVFDPLEVTRFDLGGRYPPGEPNLALTQDQEAAAYVFAGLTASSRLYAQGGTYLKSGYAAVLSPEGDVLGGVGVEASAAFGQVMDAVRRRLLLVSVAVLAGLALLGAGFARLLAAQAGLEARLRRTETLAAMGQMAAMMAHEIRNPLGIIRGAAERLAKRHGLESDEMFRFIPEEVDRLERTVSQYLDFARPEETSGVIDVRRTLERTLTLVEPELTRGGVSVQLDVDEGELLLGGEPHLLQQAFLNLALNARDAMPGGGTLSVVARGGGDRIRIRFADTGEGMTEEVRRRAIEPFFTTKAKGSGLGLAVVRRVALDLGGRLDIQSRPGEGTAVDLSFPRARPPVPPR